MPKAKNPSLLPRDERILCDLARYRYLTTRQAALLRYDSPQIASRRLRHLESAGYVVRFRAVAVPGHGSNDYIHHLTRAGAELAADRLGLDVEQIAYPKQPRGKAREPAHGWRMDHMLGVVQFWLSLDLAAPLAGATVERFIPEWHMSPNARNRLVRTLAAATPHPLRPSEPLKFIPDAALILARAGKRVLRYLEVDRATETVTSASWPDFTDKLYAYASWREHDGHRRFGEDLRGFQVLVTTVTQGRLDSYQEAASRLDLTELFLFTLAEHVTPEQLLGPIWRSVGRDAPPCSLVSTPSPLTPPRSSRPPLPLSEVPEA